MTWLERPEQPAAVRRDPADGALTTARGSARRTAPGRHRRQSDAQLQARDGRDGAQIELQLQVLPHPQQPVALLPAQHRFGQRHAAELPGHLQAARARASRAWRAGSTGVERIRSTSLAIRPEGARGGDLRQAALEGCAEPPLPGGLGAGRAAQVVAQLQASRSLEAQVGAHLHAPPKQPRQQKQDHRHQHGETPRGPGGTDGRRWRRLGTATGGTGPAGATPLDRRGAGQIRQGERPLAGPPQFRGFEHHQQRHRLGAQGGVPAAREAAAAGGRPVGVALAHQGGGHQQTQLGTRRRLGGALFLEGLQQPQHLAVFAAIQEQARLRQRILSHSAGPDCPPPWCRCRRW